MSVTQSNNGKKKKVIMREEVDACWNCDNICPVDPIEHECDAGLYYCLYDGSDIHPFNKCAYWTIKRTY